MSISVPARPRYPWLTIVLHWLTAMAVVVAVCAIWGREAVHARAWRDALLLLHRNMGWLVLPLLLARLLTRLAWRPATALPRLPTALRVAGGMSHGLLYVCLALLPTAGWLLSSARGQAVMLFGRWSLPALISPDPDLADMWKERHEALAWALGALLALHVLAALWHHFIRRDGVLRAMWPARATDK